MYSHVFVAGTFDSLHKGHESLLKRAFAEGKKVTIGVTSDDFVSKYKAIQFGSQNGGKSYRSFEERQKSLLSWLSQKGYGGRFTILTIDDPYEPAASDLMLDALVVTPDNKFRGEEINNLRKTRGLPALALLEVVLIPAEDGQPISSSRVRAGDIDTAGRLTMPESMRSILSTPLGKVLTGELIQKSLKAHAGPLLVTVGDMATKTVLDIGRVPALSIIDLKVERKPYHDLDLYLGSTKAEISYIKSGPGHISVEADMAIDEWAKSVVATLTRQKIIVVTGEEDLLTLPVVAYSPLGTYVYYGQPVRNGSQGGLVEVEVTKDTKEKAAGWLAQFSKK